MEKKGEESRYRMAYKVELSTTRRDSIGRSLEEWAFGRQRQDAEWKDNEGGALVVLILPATVPIVECVAMPGIP